MIKVGDNYLRNLEEQVQYLTDYHKVNQGLAAWGIRVVGQVTTEDELPLPYDGEYGDAIAVGTEAPFFFYIWTRASIEGEPSYWFPFGDISVVGPQGPQGIQGEKGDTGESTRWYISLVQNAKNGDLSINTNTGDVYRYENGWKLEGNIRGPQGIQGIQGPQGEIGLTGPEGPKGDTGDVGGFINIFGILDNAVQLPDPSTLDNLTAAYLVGENKDLYIQVGENSDTATWNNMGPLNVATLVTVNGQYQNIWDADTKVDQSQLDNYFAKADVQSNFNNTGTKSFAVGTSLTNTASSSLLVGNSNSNKSPYSAIFGNSNRNEGANGSIMYGSNNYIWGGNSNLVGGSNVEAYTKFSIVCGSNCYCGDRNKSNSNYGACSLVVGSSNKSRNVDASSDTKAGSYSIVGGQSNENNGTWSLLIGQGLLNSGTHKAIFGKYNSNNSDTLLEIGKGTSTSLRSNAFEVTVDGVARSYGTPTGPNDLVRMQDLSSSQGKTYYLHKISFTVNDEKITYSLLSTINRALTFQEVKMLSADQIITTKPVYYEGGDKYGFITLFDVGDYEILGGGIVNDSSTDTPIAKYIGFQSPEQYMSDSFKEI